MRRLQVYLPSSAVLVCLARLWCMLHSSTRSQQYACMSAVGGYVLQGRTRAVMLALDIVCDAVDRYKELCEGNYCGAHLFGPPASCMQPPLSFWKGRWLPFGLQQIHCRLHALLNKGVAWQIEFDSIDLGRVPVAGECVSRTQTIHGIDFSYQPPPRTVVPYAAALKGQGSR